MSGGRADILYGRNAVREALRGRRRVTRLWAAERGLAQELLEEAGTAGTPLTQAGAEQLERLCEARNHQGLVCEAEPYRYADAATTLDPEQALVIALDQIQDPQNLGAICRSAECAGADGVVIPERRSAEITPAVCRASAGAVEHLAVARVRNLADFLEAAKRSGAWIYGAEAGADTPYFNPDYRGRTVLVLGAEGGGLRTRIQNSCDQLVALPLHGRIESLNVSAAAAVLLYEALRQRSLSEPGA